MAGEGARLTDEAHVVSILPDVCKSPSTPVPYTTISIFRFSVDTVKTVRMQGAPAFVVDSVLTISSGNEAGRGGGVKSDTCQGPCEPLTYSNTVRAEGSQLVRHGDYFRMNNGNTVGVCVYIKSGPVSVSTSGVYAVKPETPEERAWYENAWDAISDAAGDAWESFGDWAIRTDNDYKIANRAVGYGQAGAAFLDGLMCYRAGPRAAGAACRSALDNGIAAARTLTTGEVHMPLMSTPAGEPTDGSGLHHPGPGATAVFGRMMNGIARRAKSGGGSSAQGLSQARNRIGNLADEIADANAAAPAGGNTGKVRVSGQTTLKFGEDDLVFGLGKEVRKLKDRAGGKLLEKAYGTPSSNVFGRDFGHLGEGAWPEFSKSALDHAAKTGRQVRFDLTHMKDLDNVLAGAGKYANKVTSHELRHIRDKWGNFKVKPKFYKNGQPEPPPWTPKEN